MSQNSKLGPTMHVPLDPFDQFIEFYQKGLFLQALQSLIFSSQSNYEHFQSSEKKGFHFLINYADACVFKGATYYSHTNLVFANLLDHDPHFKERFKVLSDQLKQEFRIFKGTISSVEELHQSTELSENEKNFFLLLKEKKFTELEPHFSSLPPLYQPFLRQKARLIQEWNDFQSARSGLAQLIEGEQGILQQPWHPFAYHQPLTLKDLNAQGEVPLIFLEPLDSVDYAHFLAPYCQAECLWIIETIAHFFQLLQFPALKEFWLRSSVTLYILELYPHKQFALQNVQGLAFKSFRPILMTLRPDFEAVLPLLEEGLSHYFSQPSLPNLEEKTPAANKLYRLANHFIFKRELERYGKSRCCAVNIEKELKNQHDPYQEDLDVLLPNDLREIFEEASKSRQVRAFAPKHHIRLAHVVQQIIDRNHSPTLMLRGLCLFADKKWFEVFVASTERLTEHVLEYPLTPYFSQSSLIRGKETIEILNKSVFPVWIDPQSPTYLSVVQHVQEFLRQLEIDIVVFHGSDELNSWCACMTDVPIRILLCDGALSYSSCFDLVLLTNQESYERNHEYLSQKGVDNCLLLFPLDVRKNWEKQPYTRQDLGLPSDSFVLTTLSSHLDKDLSIEMCQVLSEILQRCPQTVYAPIGEVNNQEQLRALFASYGVNDRVIFLGSYKNPSQVMRSANLYLNPFPRGSGWGMLGAMAAGCPVVSMYEEQGPQQVDEGAYYFGYEYVIKTSKKEDYIDLACRLIQQPELYQAWSQHALEQYEKLVDIKQYVRMFEHVLEHFMDYFSKKHSLDPNGA